MKKVTIIAANYHKAVDRMIDLAQREIAKIGSLELKETLTIPGAWEFPLAVKRAIKQDDVDGIITLGAIEKGSTGHGVAISRATLPVLLKLSLKYDKPVTLGIIGPDATLEQIDERAEPVGMEAVRAMRQLLGLGGDRER